MMTMTGRDRTIQQRVLDAFVWDPDVPAPAVGVQVDDGVVTLTGTVDTPAIDVAAKRAALRVPGVRAVADDVSVRTPTTRNATDLARAVADALSAIPKLETDRIEVVVHKGTVTLSGEVDSLDQLATVVERIQSLTGVQKVINQLAVHARSVSVGQLQAAIEHALAQAAKVDAKPIRVTEHDGHVCLEGRVRSWAEKQEAVKAVWRLKGVSRVTNKIEVQL